MVLLWLPFILLVGAQITAASHTTLLITANNRRSAVAEARANGAVNMAIFQVLLQNWTIDGATRMIHEPHVDTSLKIEDEGARIDPNVAPVLLLQALLRVCGASPALARELGQAIFEWRSLDISPSSGPAAASRYRNAGRGYLPPRSRFVSVDELGLVLGMTPALLACLEPHVSVYALSVPSLQATTDPVIRQALTEAYPYETASSAAAAPRPVTVIRITATAREAGGGQFQRVAVVRVAPVEPDDAFIYQILAWD